MPHRTTRPAVTLPEVLVVVSLIGILLGLLLPAVQQVRGASLRAACQNNLRQVALAVHHYEATHGYLPPPARVAEDRRPDSIFGNGLTWLAFILPQLEYDALWQASVEACRRESNSRVNPPHVGLATVIRPYVCPADGRLLTLLTDRAGLTAAFSSYLGVRGNLPLGPGPVVPNGVLVDGDSTVRLADVTDGTSTTLMVGERPPNERLDAGWWYTFHPASEPGPDGTYFIESAFFMQEPLCRVGIPGPGGALIRFGPGRLDNPCDRFHFWSLHGGGANFAFADASVRFLPYSALPVMHALASRNGGEAVDVPY